MLVTVYPSCGDRLIEPTSDVTDTTSRAMAATIAAHLRRCGCDVRVTVWHRGTVLVEHTLTRAWVADRDAGASRLR